MKLTIILALVLTSSFGWSSTKLNGAGATFPNPIYSKWISEYHKLNKEIQINYQSIGSGGGVQQVIRGTVDFGASDVPMEKKESDKAPFKIVHIPTVVGAVVVSYNLKDVTKPLQLDGETLVKIFQGKISKWNDSKIATLNPGVKLPEKNILVVHRADGSGTTAVFTQYLSSVSSEWKSTVGESKAVKWPTGLGGKGNEGVTGLIKQMEGSIGYIELAYAIQNNLAMASLKNAQGSFILPKLDSITAAAAGLGTNLTESIINSQTANAYPIASLTFILLPVQKAEGKYQELLKFLKWAVTDGQKFAANLHYGTLPAPLAKAVVQEIDTLSKGK